MQQKHPVKYKCHRLEQGNFYNSFSKSKKKEMEKASMERCYCFEETNERGTWVLSP